MYPMTRAEKICMSCVAYVVTLAILCVVVRSAPPAGAPSATPPTVEQLASELATMRARLDAAGIPEVDAADFAGPAPLVVTLADPAFAADPSLIRTRRVTWDFGDAAGSWNAVPGPNAGHLYRVPGRYAIRMAVDGVVTRTLSVSVKADDRPTVYLSARGDDARDGATAATAVRSWARACALVESGKARQVLIPAGETTVATQTLRLGGGRIARYPADGPVATVETPFKGGATPIVDARGERYVVDGVRFTVSGAPANEQANVPHAIVAGGKSGAVVACRFGDVGYAINGNGQPGGILVADNVVEGVAGLRGYFAWMEGSGWSLYGNVAPNSTREHIARAVAEGGYISIVCNRFANIDRRNATPPDASDTSKGSVTVQRTRIVYVADNVLDDGPVSAGPLGVDPADKAQRTVGVLFERNRIERSCVQIRHGAEAVTVRDSLIDEPYGDVAVSVDGYFVDFARGTADVRVERVTARESGTAGKFISVGAGAGGVDVASCLYVAPGQILGPYQSGSVGIADAATALRVRLSGNVWSAGKPGGAKERLATPVNVGGGYLDAAALSRIAATDKVQAIAAGVTRVGTAGVDESILPQAVK